jgi:hypothetical protein
MRRTAIPHVQQFTPAQSRRRLIGWSIAFCGFFSWAIWYSHSTQIKHTPLFKGILFTLRQDKHVRRWIGDGIEPARDVDGFINHIKGRADISFNVTGTMGAIIRFDVRKFICKARDASIWSLSVSWTIGSFAS